MASAPPNAPIAAVTDLAAACVRFVQDSLKLELDFTPETLPILDHYVRTRAEVQAASPEVRDLLTPALGAYFGEVVRRSLSVVRWHVPTHNADDHAAYRVEFETVFLHFNPMGVAREVLEKEDVAGFGAEFQVLDEARFELARVLEDNGEISADDYYSFTIRYETLEQVFAILTALEHERQALPRSFGPEVYRAAAGEPVGGGDSS